MTTPTEDKAGLKQEIIANAQRKVLLVDSSKYGAHSLFNVVPLERFNDVITDVNLPPSAQVELKGRACANAGAAGVTAPSGAVSGESDRRNIAAVVNLAHLFPQRGGDLRRSVSVRSSGLV